MIYQMYLKVLLFPIFTLLSAYFWLKPEQLKHTITFEGNAYLVT